MLAKPDAIVLNLKQENVKSIVCAHENLFPSVDPMEEVILMLVALNVPMLGLRMGNANKI
jgi:hypothetical protein